MLDWKPAARIFEMYEPQNLMQVVQQTRTAISFLGGVNTKKAF